MSDSKRNSKRKEVVDKGQKIERQKAQASGMGVVKSVESGDQLIVMGGCKPGEMPPLKKITISGINTPRLGRGSDGVDEPFAFAAKEHLRKLCIGRTIFFSVNYVHSNGREYADVFVGKHRTNLAHEMVRNGLAKVMTNKDGSVHAEKRELYDIMERAQSLGVGMWAKGVDPEDYVRKVEYVSDKAAFEFYAKNKGKPLDGVIEYVRDGSTLRVEVVDPKGSLRHQSIMVHLAGVQAPDIPAPYKVQLEQYNKRKAANPNLKQGPPKRHAPAPFSKESRQYTEARLLNRSCKLMLQAIDAYGNLFGTVLVPISATTNKLGNIATRLLEKGLSKLVRWSGRATPDLATFSALEGKARAGKVGLWANAKPEDAEIALPGDFMGKVTFINGGDSLTVNDGKVDHKLTLASVRAPRQYRGRKSEDYAFEAREYMRRKLVGKRVKVFYEYARPAPADARDQSTRFFVTIVSANKNVGSELLSAGYGSVIRHRRDENRSRFYDELLASEKKAEAAKKAMHSDKKPAPRVVIDLSYRPRKKKGAEKKTDDADGKDGEVIVSQAKGYLTSLQGQRSIRGVVEHVFSSTRYKIFLPSENLMITFLLSGCRIPSADDDKEGKFAAQALSYARDNTLQHDVTLRVEAMAGDQFVGLLYVNKKCVNSELLRMGVVDMFRYSAEKSSGYQGMLSARDEAKSAKRNFWHDWEQKQAARRAAREAKDAAAAAEQAAIDAKTVKVKEGGKLNVIVTEVIDAANFFVTLAGDSNAEVVANAMAEFTTKRSDDAADSDDAAAKDAFYDENGNFIPERNDIVAGQYEDGSWHRVQIDGGNVSKGWKVQFVDFGNYDELSADKVLPLPASLKKIKPLARRCVLSCCMAPPRKSEHFVPAGEKFTDYTFEQKLVGKVDAIDRDGRIHLTLTHAEPVDGFEASSINSAILRDGLCRLSARPTRGTYDLQKKLEKDEEYAKREHNAIWEYGDVSDGEADDGMWRPHTNKKDDDKAKAK